MNIFQALLIAILSAVTSWWSPFCYGSLGGMISGRPLIAGFLCGLILGDVKQGIILGAAIQAVYIGAVYVGGGVAANISFAEWIAIPLTMLAGKNAAYALALAIPLSMVGTLGSLFTMNANLFFVHKQDKYIEEGKLKKAALMPVVGQIDNLIVYFIPVLLINYFGVGLATKITSAVPASVNSVLGIFGGMMPLLGFTILLTMILKKKIDLIYYFLGFICVSVGKLSMIPIVIIGFVLAYIIFQADKGTAESSKGADA